MKYLIGAFVVIMLFLLPLGSWYYLQSGLDYRKEALRQLEPKGKFQSTFLNQGQLAAKTTMIHLKEVEGDPVSEIYGQYGDSETFQLFSIDTPEKGAQNWIQLDALAANSISAAYDDAGFLLIDTSGQLRNTYPANLEGVKFLIEHTSIVLPRVKEMDIKMKG